MDIFKDLEAKIRIDNDFLGNKAQILLDKLGSNEVLLKGLFDLAELCQFYAEYVIKKKEKSSLYDKYGDINHEMTLWDLVGN